MATNTLTTNKVTLGLNMNIKQLATAFSIVFVSTTLVMTTAATVNAQTDRDENYKIYVYKDCQKLEEIAMTSAQRKAYQALNAHEFSMEGLEEPLAEMEKELAVYEEEIDNLEDELVVESDNQVIINKAAVKKHQAIAEKMQLVVQSHQLDIQHIEKQAHKIKAAAKNFEALIKPSLLKYQDRNVDVSIGSEERNRQCARSSSLNS